MKAVTFVRLTRFDQEKAKRSRRLSDGSETEVRIVPLAAMVILQSTRGERIQLQRRNRFNCS
jgi:hypothetical protein